MLRSTSDMTLVSDTAQGLCIVEFGADWCAPCKQLMPEISKLSKQYPDAKFLYMDVEQNVGATNRYQISGLPSFAVFYNGNLVEMLLGPRASVAGITEVLGKDYSNATHAF
jgi:thioredoxin 1